MKNIIYALFSFIEMILIFIVQNIMFLTSSGIVYLYETISDFELYA
ncbi:MAG: hypothetical protein MR911_07780 [Spirochaetia bacterium]|nr:hypothetical protein [Spirochaetia bacterium]